MFHSGAVTNNGNRLTINKKNNEVSDILSKLPSENIILKNKHQLPSEFYVYIPNRVGFYLNAKVEGDKTNVDGIKTYNINHISQMEEHLINDVLKKEIL